MRFYVRSALHEATDDELLAEVDKRFLAPGVKNRELVELYIAAKANDMETLKFLVSRISQIYLGKVIT